MPVNLALGHVSTGFMIAALMIYSLAVLAFAADFAFGRPKRGAVAGRTQVRTLEKVGAVSGAPVHAASGAGILTDPDADVLAGLDADVSADHGVDGLADPAAGASSAGGVLAASGAGSAVAGGHGDGGAGVPDSMPAIALSPLRAIMAAGPWVRAGMALSTIGVLAQAAAVSTRGLAVHRAPWGNMYEFVTALTCFAAIFFLWVMIRYRAWALGVFVMGAVVVILGLAETLIYTAAGNLVPALQSYWLSIHVTAMTVATGVFFVAAVLGAVYIVVDVYNRRVAAGKAEPGNGIIARLPSLEQLDRLAYRTVVFGFPVWTFGVMAGAIWADEAWGRYWGWDPVETWAFITWVVYAAFLHARATAGWRGRRAHYVQLLGFGTLAFNILIVQVFITGLHSYAGVG
jgi:cytochrome c-type biogenesis protein CcsB